MNCKKCGSPLTENDQFCKVCGAAINETSVPSTNTVGNYMNYSTPTNSMNNPMGQPMNSSTNNSINNSTNNNTNNNMNNNINNNINNNMNNNVNNGSAWANSYNSQPTYNQMPQKNNGNTKFIIIGIVIAVAIFAGIIIVGMFSGDNETSNGGTSSNGGSSSQVSKSTYNVKFKGFTFKIPTNLVYETETDSIILGDEEGTWATYIGVIEGSYSQMLANKSKLQGVYQQMGYTSSAAIEKTIGGMPFITLEISMSGTNALLGLAKANSMNLFGITAYNIDNEYDYKLLETVSSILNTAEYTGETNNMSVFEKVDMSGISSLAK